MKKKTSKNKKRREVVDAAIAGADGKKPKTKNPGPKRNPSVNYDTFVKIWIASGSVGQVAKELGIQKTTASAIAGRIRRAGVELKKFERRVKQPINVKRLNRIARGKALA